MWAEVRGVISTLTMSAPVLKCKALLFIGVRNKYSSIGAINTRNNKLIPIHHYYRNWCGSSFIMEVDFILKGFQLSEEMHVPLAYW